MVLVDCGNKCAADDDAEADTAGGKSMPTNSCGVETRVVFVLLAV